ncbi:hypothetical protein NJB1808e29_01360 [Mycobacterium marinum]|nr:hypothetical protein NJB1808e29_01360 [Mycobacterium marinum]GJP24512.1 hypothetical protein NJB1808_32230 [Mycobacterium marinum]
MRDSVDVGGERLQAAVEQLLGHPQRFGPEVCWHWAAGIAQDGNGEMDQVGTVCAADDFDQGGIIGKGRIGGQGGAVEFIEPLLGGVESDARGVADQLAHAWGE